MSAWTSSRTMRTTSWSISEREPYAWSLTPAFQLTTQKLEGAGRVILIGPGACALRYAAWSPVSRRRGRSRPPTTLDVLGSARALDQSRELLWRARPGRARHRRHGRAPGARPRPGLEDLTLRPDPSRRNLHPRPHSRSRRDPEHVVHRAAPQP